MKSKIEIAEMVKKRKKESNRNLGRQRENTKRCRAFYAGDYMEYMDKIQIATTNGQKKRVTVQINKIKPYVNAVKGFLAQNRRKPNYIARVQQSQAQELYSKYAKKLSEYMRGNMNADQIETQQDGDLLTNGIGVVETAMSYGEGYASRSANGEVVMSCVDLDTFWWDAAARETNLADSRFMGITKIYALEDALELFADSEEEDFETTSEKSVSDYQYQPDIGHYDRLKYDWADEKERTVHVDFFHWYDIETFYRADNPLSELKNPQSKLAAQMEMERIAQEIPLDKDGKPTDPDFDPADEIIAFNEETKALLEEAFGEFIFCEPFRRKVFYSSVTSGDKTFTAFKAESQDGFSIKVKTGDYDAKNKIWTGMVNSMMEPQKYYNKALTELMFVIAANSKGGVIIESDAVEDIEEFEDQYAKTDAVCVVEPGALTGPGGPKIKDKRSPFQPTGYEQIITIADSSIADVSGIDRTFLGSSENGRETAQLQRQRIRQIVSSLACYVDSITLYAKDHARLMLSMMRVYAENNRGDLFRILDEGAAVFVQLSEEFLSPEFDVEIEESPVTPEERQEMADKLNATGDKYLSVGDTETAKMFHAAAVNYMVLDEDDAKNIKDMLQPQGQQPSPAQIQQILAENQALKSEMNKAQIDNVNALTKKTLQDAVKSGTEAQLNTVKAADIRAGVHKKSAETSKTLEDATGKHIENKFTSAHPQEVFAPKQKPAAKGTSK